MTLIFLMLGEVVVWFLKWYYFNVELWMTMYKVLKIKFKTPKTIVNRNVLKGHLAIRLSDTKVSSSCELMELIKYVHSVFGVKHLTVISGAKGFEKEIELSKKIDDITFNIYHNFEPVLNDLDSQSISVNLIDDDSQNLFLLKLNEQSTVQDSCEDVLKSVLSTFTSKQNIIPTLHYFNFKYRLSSY